MEACDKNEIIDNNLINYAQPPVGQHQLKNNEGYNCSECSSLIEIKSINEDNLSFHCANNHNIENIIIKEYLEKMSKFKDINNMKVKCETHDKDFVGICFNCKCHLCNDCFRNERHKNHNKKSFLNLYPYEENKNEIKNRIDYYMNQIKEIKKKKDSLFKTAEEKINKMIEINKINEKNEIKKNENKYQHDLNEIKRKYEEEIEKRKIKYEKDNNIIKDYYRIMKENNIKEIENECEMNKLKYNKQKNDMENLIKLNEIIINTYEKCNNNYYYITNINNISKIYKENKIIENNIKENKNYIIGEILITEKEINKKIRIINSFEEMRRNQIGIDVMETDFYKYENEKEIKANCKIKINTVFLGLEQSKY